MERILSEAVSGIDDRLREVIRDGEAWNAFWSAAMENRQPTPETPAVDFESEMVIVASMGRRGTGGYSIAIEDVTRDSEGDLTVVVRETAPGSNCFLIQAFTAPVTAVKVPRGEGEVTFLERTERTEC
jgi:hypothetical protein